MNRPDSRKLEPILAIGLPAVLFLLALRRAGLWDPYEMQLAENARRAAIHVFGASQLALEGAENSLPTLGDLGRNELPVTSAALGFRLFGLHEWAGRLPLALWGIGGVAVLWLWLARMVAPRAATYAALLLATTPLYFVQARTMLGDIVTMSSVLAATAGLSVVAFSRRRDGEGPGVFLAWGALALAGLIGGFLSRGALVGVALPCLTIGLSWGLLRGEDDHLTLRAHVVGSVALSLGAVAACAALVALGRATTTTYEILLGAIAVDTKKYPTFDQIVSHLGHSLFPWSAFLPVAIGRLMAAPTSPPGPLFLKGAGDENESAGDEEGARNEGKIAASVREETRVRLVLLVGSGLAYGVYALIAPKVGLLPFGGVGLVIAVGALALYDFERGAPPSRALAVIASLLAALLYLDLSRMPEKAFAAFGVTTAVFPESFRGTATRLLAASTLLFLVPMFLAFLDRDGPLPAGRAGVSRTEGDGPRPVSDTAPVDDPEMHPMDRYQAYREVREILEELQQIWEGNLGFFAVMLEAAMVGVAVLVFVGERLPISGAPLQATFSTFSRVIALNAWWAVPAVLIVGLWVFLSARKLLSLGLASIGWSRARFALAGGVMAGLVLATGYYPALAGQLSPREVFDTYERTHHEGEPLGLLGVSERMAAYYAVSGSRTFADPTQAFSWLTDGDERRWLAVRAEDVRRLNALYRSWAAHNPGVPDDHNLPVIDARSSQIQLVSDRFVAGERADGDLGRIVSSVPPTPAHTYEINLNDQLMAIGWSLFDGADERPVDHVTAGRKYTLHLHYKVLATLTTDWESFVHVDGFGRRFNGDHKLPKYPMTLWLPGDYITDRFEFQLEPNFSPGNYTLLYGFFIGDTRLTVRGEGERMKDNRVNGGPFLVR